MLATERHAIILDELERKPTLSIRDLTEKLDVSRETVRKDIEHLAQEQRVEQIRGGVTKIRTRELPVSNRAELNMPGKTRIAEFLANEIPNRASLFLDNGSSILALAAKLNRHKGLIVYTNDLRVAEVIAPATAELVIIGGRIDVTEMAVHGAEAMENLAHYRAEYAIVSTGGLSADTFLTDFSREASSLRHQMLVQSRQPIILADSYKFGVVGHVVFPDPPAGTRIITDTAPDPEIENVIADKGLRLNIAN